MSQPWLDRSACRATVRLAPHLEAPAYRAIFHALPHAALLTDAESRVILANRAAAQLFGVQAERLTGISLATLVPTANLDVLLRDLTDRPKVIEVSTRSKTLKIRALRVSQTHAHGACKLIALDDISDTAALEQLLVETEKQAAMGQLAAGILHEVANPLMSLGSNLIFVRHALAGNKDADLRQALDVSLEQLEQMRQLLGTLSGLPGRQLPRYELVDLHEMLRRTVTFVAKEAERRQIRLAVSFAASPITCELDVRLMKQVLLNLLKNAMEAMPRGGSLTVSTSHDAGIVTIEVADTGVGISDSDLRRAFRPLFSTKPRGAGLGLSFCRQAVEDHGGEIRLTSRGRDHGTAAIVALPARQPSAADESE